MELVWRAGPVPLSLYLPSREEGPTDFSYLNGMPGHCRPREVGRKGERTSRIRLAPGPVGKRPCDTCAGGPEPCISAPTWTRGRARCCAAHSQQVADVPFPGAGAGAAGETHQKASWTFGGQRALGALWIPRVLGEAEAAVQPGLRVSSSQGSAAGQLIL